jgi:epoxyqueuosine reductase
MFDLPARLKSFAHSLGFAFVGLTPPEPPLHVAGYERWLANGYHGEMGYLDTDRARQRRADPAQILPSCKTILVAALPYPSGPGNTHGPIAAYAQGDDYHDVIPPKLAQLVSWLESEVGHPIEHKIYTDTGPILERELAQRAGVGWIGKNTMLINPKGGSYFLLGEVLLDLELPPDPPFAPDLCGTCTRCIQACPTEAILPNRVLDARRCISYLTIELKGSIPEDLRDKMGGWIFGCDICQAVCPWNVRFAATLTPDPALQPRRDPPQLTAELSLTPEQFNAKFKGTPIKRAKRKGYLRNVAVALGNSDSEESAKALEKCLEFETEPLVHEHAEWALNKRRGNSPSTYGTGQV